tara:strand:- start:478 stop:687 length:210 start_codon:yes stop_codon:yes gene_type:complete
MYYPPIFHEDRIDVMQDLMHAHPLLPLITVGENGPDGNHMPFEFVPSEDGDPGIAAGTCGKTKPGLVKE